MMIPPCGMKAVLEDFYQFLYLGNNKEANRNTNYALSINIYTATPTVK